MPVDSGSLKPAVQWECIEDGQLAMDPVTLTPQLPPDAAPLPSASSKAAKLFLPYQLACTGEAFEFLLENSQTDQLHSFLMKTAVFARMSPEQKHRLVEQLQLLNYTVAFCGDGANDCAALKAADVGISLSQAEASIAAPFSSQTTDIRCVLDVIREGRCALVTSFSAFKFMALYSLIQFTTAGLLCAKAVFITDSQYIYIDLLLILPVALAMSRFEAAEAIGPKRPTAKLISKRVMTSIVWQIALQASFQFFLMFHAAASQDAKGSSRLYKDEEYESIENSVLFLVSNFLYVNVAVLYCADKPYRRAKWRTPCFVAACAVLTASNVVLVFLDQISGSVASLMNLVRLSVYLRVVVVGCAASHLVLGAVGERIVLPKVVGVWKRRRKPLN
jgi:cation-transporting ATPase 13A2